MKKYLQVLLIAVCVLLGAAFFVYTVARPRLLLFRSLYVERPVTATGVITGFDTRASVTDGIKVQSRFPVVEFVTEDGVKRKFTSEITARPDMKKGDTTEVLFNAKKAVIKQEYVSMRNALIVRVVLASLAAGAIIAGTLYAFFSKPKQEKPKKKRRNPYKKYLWRS